MKLVNSIHTVPLIKRIIWQIKLRYIFLISSYFVYEKMSHQRPFNYNLLMSFSYQQSI